MVQSVYQFKEWGQLCVCVFVFISMICKKFNKGTSVQTIIFFATKLIILFEGMGIKMKVVFIPMTSNNITSNVIFISPHKIGHNLNLLAWGHLIDL
jgi:hypothetical protein